MKNGNLSPVMDDQCAIEWWRKIDQIKEVVNSLKPNPNSRRMLVFRMEPSVLPDTSLSFSENVANAKSGIAPMSCHFFNFMLPDGKLLPVNLYQKKCRYIFRCSVQNASLCPITYDGTGFADCNNLAKFHSYLFGDATHLQQPFKQVACQLSRSLKPLQNGF